MNNLELIEKEETNRCKFRLVKDTDEKDIFEILSDEDVITNLNMDIHKSILDTRQMLKDYKKEFINGNKLPLAIISKDTNEFIGVFLIKLDLYNEDAFECTVYLKKKFWNKGIYSEILPSMIKFAFEVIHTKNFRGYVMEKNKPSSKGLEKNGFKLEKIFNVPGIDEKIYSYLMTLEMYERNGRKIKFN